MMGRGLAVGAGQPGGQSSAWRPAVKVMVTPGIFSPASWGPLPLASRRGRAVAAGALALVVGGLACPYAY